MTHTRLLTLIPLLLCGCVANRDVPVAASVQPNVVTTAPKRESNPATKAAMRAYAQCSRTASQIVSSQNDDPVSLAIAALGFCRPEAGAARKEIAGELEGHSPLLAIKAMETFEAQLVKANTSWIVQERIRIAQR